jgi:hypothetical protein
MYSIGEMHRPFAPLRVTFVFIHNSRDKYTKCMKKKTRLRERNKRELGKKQKAAHDLFEPR